MGRVFTRKEDDQHELVVVLSYSTWQSRFHGDARYSGEQNPSRPQALSRDWGDACADFEFPLIPGHLDQCELWVPMSFKPEQLMAGASSWEFQMVGRLRRGLTPEQATIDAERVAEVTMRNYPAYMASIDIAGRVRPLREQTVRAGMGAGHNFVLGGLRGAIDRLCKPGRVVAGAGDPQAQRHGDQDRTGSEQGGAPKADDHGEPGGERDRGVGRIGAGCGCASGRADLLPETLPRVNEIGLDLPVVCFALLLAVLTGVACGLVPAFAAIRTGLSDALKEGGRTGSSGEDTRGYGRPWWLRRLPSRWCCWRLPDFCCAAFKDARG